MFPRFVVPRMLTKAEERRLLATVRAKGSRRDVALLTLALGTGLRLREIRGLNVAGVLDGNGTAWKVALDPATTKGQTRRDGLPDGSCSARDRILHSVEAAPWGIA